MMKQYLHSTLLIAGLGLLQPKLMAQELKVFLNQGATSSFVLTDLSKITFTNSGLNLHQQSGGVTPYSFDQIQRITFDGLVNGVKQLEPLSSSIGVMVYPNPNSGTFTVDYVLDQSSLVVLELYGMSGELLFQHKSTASQSGVNSIQLVQGNGGLPLLANGFYYLRIQSVSGSISKKILVIN